MDADGFGQTQLTTFDWNQEPARSSDGKKIAFMSGQTGSDLEIWRMRADGSNQVQLTDNTAVDQSPSWQPIP